MPINIKRKEPEQPKELPIAWVETPGAEVGLQVRFVARNQCVGIQYDTGMEDGTWGVGAGSARLNITPSDVRELANALLKMADQIEGK